MYRYEQGEPVRLLYDLYSDGTVATAGRGDLIAKAGETGYVHERGTFLDDLVYDVRFLDGDRIVGCREKELIPADAPWTPPRHAKGDRVAAAVPLTFKGTPIAAQGAAGTVTAVRYLPSAGYAFEIAFDGSTERAMVTAPQVVPADA